MCTSHSSCRSPVLATTHPSPQPALQLALVCRLGALQYVEQFSLAHNLNLVLFYVAAVYRVLALLELPDSVNIAGNEFVPFRRPAKLLAVAEDLNAFNAFLTWVKVFMYLNFVPKFQILLGTLSRAAGKVSGFAVICAIVLFGSSQVEA